MFLRKNHSTKTGRTHLSIVQGYRDNEGKTRHRTVKALGYLDVLEKEYQDPIAHFTQVASQMDEERMQSKSRTITIDMSKEVERGQANRKNYGYIVLSRIYHELEIDRFLKNARRHEDFKFNTDAIMRLLVYARLLYPGSKRASTLSNVQLKDAQLLLGHADISTTLNIYQHGTFATQRSAIDAIEGKLLNRAVMPAPA